MYIFVQVPREVSCGVISLGLELQEDVSYLRWELRTELRSFVSTAMAHNNWAFLRSW